MLKKIISLTCAAAVTTSLGIATAHAERLSISTWGSPKHYQVSQFVPQFEKLISDKSDGKLRTRSFSGGEMVKQQFVATAVPQGTIDISLTTMDNWSGRVPEVSILTTPLWKKSITWTRDNLKPGNPIFDFYDQKFREQGAVILAIFDIGSPVISSRFPLMVPPDLNGKTVRVYSKGAAQLMQSLGATPTIMSVGDVYSGLQRGTVEGAMGGLGGAVGLKHYEVAEHFFVPNGVLGTLLHAYIMNREKFESLSPQLQEVVMDAALEARNSMQQFAIDEQSRLIDIVKQNGNLVEALEPSSESWSVWEKALSPFSNQSRVDYPADLVKLIDG